jgi:hypothetical protein
MGNKRASQALFRSVSGDGVDWLFVVRSEFEWAITRNGVEVAIGSGNPASVGAGVRKFLSLTRVIVASDDACDPAVGRLLNRIEREGPATERIPKYQERIRPHASKEASAYLTA